MRLHVQFSIWVLLPANQSFHSPYARDRNFSEGSTIIQEWYQTLWTTARQHPLSQRPFYPTILSLVFFMLDGTGYFLIGDQVLILQGY
jgi:hypothetical protein